MSTGQRQFQVTVASAGSPSTQPPSWWAAMPERQWAEIPGTSVGTAQAAFLSDPAPYPSFHSLDAIFSAESGMCIDQANRELFWLCNGGHSRGYTNDGLALRLNDAAPAVFRMHGRTPWYGDVVEVGTVGSFDAQKTPVVGASTLTVSGTFVNSAGTYNPYASPQGGAKYCVRFTSGNLNGSIYVISRDYNDGQRKLTIAKPNVWSLDATAQFLTSGWLDTAPSVGSTFEVRIYYICNRRNFASTFQPAVYDDGRPWSLHTVQQAQYANGRIWYPMSNSIGAGAGQSTLTVFSYKRNAIRGQEPIAWSTSSIHPFEIHGAVGDPANPNNKGLTFTSSPSGINSDYGFCPSVLDPSTNLLWYIGAKSNTRYYWSVDTNPGKEGEITLYRSSTASTPFTSMGEMWGVCIPDVKFADGTSSIMVVARQSTKDLYVLRFDKAGTDAAKFGPVTTAWPISWGDTTATWGNTTTGFGQDWGAVWDEESKAIVVYLSEESGSGFTLGRNVRVLQVPMAADRSINFNTTWQWQEVTLGGVLPPKSEGIGVFSRFNMINNMGDGSRALIYAARASSPIYICKVTGPLI